MDMADDVLATNFSISSLMRVSIAFARTTTTCIMAVSCASWDALIALMAEEVLLSTSPMCSAVAAFMAVIWDAVVVSIVVDDDDAVKAS